MLLLKSDLLCDIFFCITHVGRRYGQLLRDIVIDVYKRQTTIRMLFVLVLLIGVSGTGLVVGIARAYVDTAPVLDLTLFDQQSQTSFIYDRDGNLITDFKGTENRIYASIDEMPEMLQNAFIAIEDSRFREHNGVDVKRIIGAFVYNVTGSGTTQGGSTITQQLRKQTILTTEQTYKRKIQEAYLCLLYTSRCV